MADLIERAKQQLSKCDTCKDYKSLTSAFDQSVGVTLQALLRLPLVRDLSETVAPANCCHPLVNGFRKEFLDDEDDVYFLILSYVQKLVKEETKNQKAFGGAAGVAVGRTKRDRSGGANTPRGPSSSDTTTFVANVYTLLFGRQFPDVEKMTLRWSFLSKEKETFMKSSAYVQSNAAERRTMHQGSVLSIFSIKAHKHMFTALWTGVFACRLPPALQVHLLTGIGHSLMPHLTNPLALSDYLTHCFSIGGLSAVLALEGIFLLMVDHGLEYPQFYQQLYSLLDANAFATRHRNQLFRLIDACLTGILVPAHVAAAFIKKTARVALFAPTPVLYFVLPFLRHLLQRHPNCLKLIHRSRKELQDLLERYERGEKITNEDVDNMVALDMGSSDDEDEDEEEEDDDRSEEGADETEGAAEGDAKDESENEEGAAVPSAKKEPDAIELLRIERLKKLFEGIDPFQPDEKELAKCHALDSSLWELCVLEKHYLPAVNLMVSSYASPAEDTAALKFEKSYTRLFAHEVTRSIKTNKTRSTVAYEAPPRVGMEKESCLKGIFTF